jgi:hypothetical protein
LNIEYFPTIYVIDAKGVIRFRSNAVSDEDLEKAVNEVIKEMEKK